ncbi:thiamine pyrophosphate-dependent enzyme [Ethanoligenens sp.]|uniref:thiamine pyrophosphate-dependent enzyme n=1 Tax=Ethanoligenens sp. TaxID=2099655 RepID=UPI0039ED06B2
MSRRMLSGNEAAACAALHAGVKVVSGYPGTPSTELIGSLWNRQLEGTVVEWSTNEKVAFEVAAGAALNGYRALCTMKMSGVNVAYDSIIGIAYSGCPGGLVIYVADDPGVSAGMCEQDTRGFALMSDMPVLEPSSVEESYTLMAYAFELAEQIQSPVFVRSVTNVSQSHAAVEVGEPVAPPETMPMFVRDTDRYTKAGAAICMTQHANLIASLAMAGECIERDGLNRETLSAETGGVGVISVGVTNDYVAEALLLAQNSGLETAGISTLRLVCTLPYADTEMKALLAHCDTVVVVEELEPYLENRLIYLAYEMGRRVRILGKQNGIFRRIGEYSAKKVAGALFTAFGKALPAVLEEKTSDAPSLCAARPITVCAGCPHRGVYMSVNQAVRNLHMKKDEVIVTGDIGCTILGVNPPFDTLWTELAMGASIPLAQGFVYAGQKNPVIATIGDSTFFHAGIPGLVNAVQHGVDLTVIVMDNGWTAMTGMQVNAGTADVYQHDEACRSLDLEKVISGLGVDKLTVTDPYDLEAMTQAVEESLKLPGVKVVLTRRECAIQAGRRKVSYGKVTVDAEKCTRCKRCIVMTGCPALSLDEKQVTVDAAQCNGCGICTQVCGFGALVKEEK